MNKIKIGFQSLGGYLAGYLNRPKRGYKQFSVSDPEKLASVIRPCDVLLIEGDRRLSSAIKYLTQSTWSHTAIYVGDALGKGNDPYTSPTLIEADVKQGVIAVPLSKFGALNTRICRPVGLLHEDVKTVVDYVTSRIGMSYDLKNVFDLLRYLVSTPPVPVPWRRRMLALGSGDPTRAICSTLVAQAFQQVRYPILPRIEEMTDEERERFGYTVNEIHHIRHYSLFAPRDFDLSPYFEVVKPTIEGEFNYRQMVWAEPDSTDGDDLV